MSISVEALRQNIRALEDDLRAARAALLDEELRLARERGIYVGAIVTVDGEDYRLSEVNPRGSYLELYGNPRRKDGSFGTARRYIPGRYKLKEAS